MTDRDVLRGLAARWMALAAEPVMAERRRLWTALHDLHGERPMVLFETGLLENFVTEDELECQDPANRGVEKSLRWTLRHIEEVADDTVLEPYWPVHWQMSATSYGVETPSHRATDSDGGSQGYTFTHPLQTPDDLDRLQPRTWTVQREATLQQVERLDGLFGDILPIRLQGTGCHVPGITAEVFRLAGNENLLMWPYDEPETMHRLMGFLRDDRLAMYRWMEREGLLGVNTHCSYIGSGSPGYTSALPQPTTPPTPAKLSEIWVWMESQETTMVSPEMFAEFFLPYLAEVAACFGLVYYGCCEPVHDRWTYIREAIPNIRSVSVSPWNDLALVGELFGQDYVYSRKPAPTPMSGLTPDWEALEADIDATLAAAQGCNLEIVFRDVYRIHGDTPRLRRWVEMVRDRGVRD